MTRSRLSGSTFHTSVNHELIARVLARKKALLDLGIEPERLSHPTVHEKPSFWAFFRRKM